MMFERRLSQLEKIRDLFFGSGFGEWKRCVRCGGEEKPWPTYNEDRSSNQVSVGVTPVCERCWEELPAEGRFQWVLMLMACWAEEYREKPISYDPPHFQARYRDWPILLESARRALFEPPSLGLPRFGPSYVGYRRCYVDSAKHELFPIPPLGMQICTVCRGWFDEAGEHCEPWEFLGVPEAEVENAALDERARNLRESGPHYCRGEHDEKVEMIMKDRGMLSCPSCGGQSAGGIFVAMAEAE